MNAMMLSEPDLPARQFIWPSGGIKKMEAQLARLEANVGHVQSDTTAIKEDLRRTNVRIDEITPRLEKIRDRIEVGNAALTSKIELSHSSLTRDVENLRKESTVRMDAIAGDITGLRESIAGLRESIAMVKELVTATKLWTLRLVVTVGVGGLYLIAHGFKWL